LLNYINECETTEKELETVSKKAVEQYHKDSRLIAILETRNMRLKRAYEQYLKEGGELSFDDIIKNVKRGPR